VTTDAAPRQVSLEHARRTCGSRVFRAARAEQTLWCCWTCGARSEEVVEKICGCGLQPAGGAPAARFRCRPNPSRGPASPALIIITRADPASSGSVHV
jgi:hypothetical protein